MPINSHGFKNKIRKNYISNAILIERLSRKLDEQFFGIVRFTRIYKKSRVTHGRVGKMAAQLW